jgi:hypothetical protein
VIAMEDYGPLTKGLIVIAVIVEVSLLFCAGACAWDGEWLGAVRRMIVAALIELVSVLQRKILGFL